MTQISQSAPNALPQIETERLLLRPTAFSDFDRWSEMMGNEDAARYLGGVQPKPVVWRSLMSMAGAWSLTGVAMFSLIEKRSGLWVGRVGPWQPYGWPGTEVGWGLHPEAWGKGYALEAAQAAIAYAFETLGWQEVIHCINPLNTPSQRLARRVGATLRGPGRVPPPFEHEPVEIWGQTREEWAARTLRTARGG